jgi:signal peptidase II
VRFPLGRLPFLALGAAWLAADQASKIAVDAAGWKRPVVLIPGLLDFAVRGNHGGAWGLLADASESFRLPFFVVSSFVAVVVLFLLRPRLFLHRPWADVAFPAILGGAVGNLVDRVRLGYVIDFVDVHIGSFTWPTFNVADIGITLGVILLLLDSVFAPRGAAGAASEPGSPAPDARLVPDESPVPEAPDVPRDDAPPVG